MINRKKESGATLIVVLIVLLVLLIIAVALLGSSSQTSKMAGNIAFKKSAILASDVGVLNAKTYIEGNLTPNVSALPVYYNTRQVENPLGIPAVIDWTVVPVQNINNMNVQYVIDRLCSVGNVTVPIDQCYISTSDSVSGGSNRAGQTQVLSGAIAVYYRVTLRVTGGKDSESIVQALISG